MVANRTDWQTEAAPDHAKQFDPGESAQGHVGQRIKQHFKVLRERVAENRQLRIRATEFLITDQFGNLYVTFRAVLPDGEVYDVTDWVAIQKPMTGVVLVKEFKQFKAFNDAMLAYLQDKAFVALGRECLAIMKGKIAGKPVEIMSTGQELTECAHLLADKIIAKARPTPKADDAPAFKEAPTIALL